MPIINAEDHRPTSIFSKVKDAIFRIIKRFHVRKPVDDSRTLRTGWVIYEELGMIVVGDYATSKIDITDDA